MINRQYDPAIFANLITGVIFAIGNVVIILVPMTDAATIATMGAVNSIGLLVAFLVTGKLAQRSTTPINPETGQPLNHDYMKVA